MKSSMFAIAIAPLLSSLAACAALPQAGSGLSNEAPPPSCLYACIQKHGNCAICTPDGDAKITACYEATCGNPPMGQNPYAGVYYGSICPDGGYQDYSTTPPNYVIIPPSNCTE